MEETSTQTGVILYEVFVGEMPDGRQIMTQIFRRQGDDRSIVCQIAFRDHTGETWGPPVRLDTLHSLSDTETGRPA
jgi:hypothetical protein